MKDPKAEYLSYWRLNIGHDIFLSILIKNCREYDVNLINLENASDEPNYPNPLSDKDEIEDLLTENFTCIIVFTAMFLESYIYDFAGRNLGDRYATDYLDKLDAVSKWMVIPKLVTGKQIDKTHHSFGIFKQVVGTRNKIIHWKSEEGSFKKIAKTYDKTPFYKSLNPAEILKTIKNLFEQLQEIDEEDPHILRIRAIDKYLKSARESG